MKHGFTKIGTSEEWRSCYYHPSRKVYLMIYVDDFKMAGPKAEVANCWADLRKGIDMGENAPVTHFLGCKHEVTDGVASDGLPVRVMSYNMQSFLENCITKYEALAGPDFKCTKAKTPFVEEDDRDNVARTARSDGPGLVCPWRCGAFLESEFAKVNGPHEALEAAKTRRTEITEAASIH